MSKLGWLPLLKCSLVEINMNQDIVILLKDLDRWFQELPGGAPSRSSLICKLSYLELCGWIEQRLDSLVVVAASNSGVDCNWVQENLIKNTHGFKYQDHFRPMICSVLGEVCVAKIELHFSNQLTDDITVIKGILGSLWKIRGALAHTSTGSLPPLQKTLQAPSWVINQQRILSKAFDRYEAQLVLIAASASSL